MKLNPIRIANAFAISQGIIGALCALLTFFAPGFVIKITEYLSHPLDISSLVPAQPRPVFGVILLGLVLWIAVAWLSGWLLAHVYNAFVPSPSELAGGRQEENKERLVA